MDHPQDPEDDEVTPKAVDEGRFDLGDTEERAPSFEPGPTHRERFETGLQDTLDLSDWRMPSFRDYFWYILVYGSLITLAVYVVVRYHTLWAFVLWGGYLVILVILAALIVRSMGYRRGTFSKSFDMATLDLQQAVEWALDDVGVRIETMEQPRGALLRPMISVYHLLGRDYTLSVEGRPHLRHKVVRVGRFGSDETLNEGMRICLALDHQIAHAIDRAVPRALFR